MKYAKNVSTGALGRTGVTFYVFLPEFSTVVCDFYVATTSTPRTSHQCSHRHSQLTHLLFMTLSNLQSNP
jgi:hypothetical protein